MRSLVTLATIEAAATLALTASPFLTPRRRARDARHREPVGEHVVGHERLRGAAQQQDVGPVQAPRVDRRRLGLARDPGGGGDDAPVRRLALRLAQQLRVVDAVDVEAIGQDHGRRHEGPRERAPAGLVGARDPREPLAASSRSYRSIVTARLRSWPAARSAGTPPRSPGPPERGRCTQAGRIASHPSCPGCRPGRTACHRAPSWVGSPVEEPAGSGTAPRPADRSRRALPVRSISTVSPGRPATRFTKSSCGGFATPRVSPSQCRNSADERRDRASRRRDPRRRSRRRDRRRRTAAQIRQTRIRSPSSSVGTIDADGIENACTTRSLIAIASSTAAPMSTGSSRQRLRPRASDGEAVGSATPVGPSATDQASAFSSSAGSASSTLGLGALRARRRFGSSSSASDPSTRTPRRPPRLGGLPRPRRPHRRPPPRPRRPRQPRAPRPRPSPRASRRRCGAP